MTDVSSGRDICQKFLVSTNLVEINQMDAWTTTWSKEIKKIKYIRLQYIHVWTFIFYGVEVWSAKPITMSLSEESVRLNPPIFLYLFHYTKHVKEHVFSLVILMSCYLVKQTSLNIFRQSNNAPNNLNWKNPKTTKW